MKRRVPFKTTGSGAVLWRRVGGMMLRRRGRGGPGPALPHEKALKRMSPELRERVLAGRPWFGSREAHGALYDPLEAPAKPKRVRKPREPKA